MGFRFRKSINLGKGFRINLSKSGLGYSWGTKGIRLTKTAKGSVRTTLGIPGTGLSYSTESSGKKKNQKTRQEEKEELPIGYDEDDAVSRKTPEKEQEKSAGILVLKVALWILTGFFALVAAANIPQPVGFVALAAAALLLPIAFWQNIVNRFINLDGWLKLLVIVALIVATFVMGPFQGFAKWLPQQEPASDSVTQEQNQTAGAEQGNPSVQQEYILNTGTKKFHDPECGLVAGMKEEKKETYYGLTEELLGEGYSPCGSCDP